MVFSDRRTSIGGSFRLAALASLVSLIAWLGCGPAHAELKLCNQTSYVVYAAVGIQQPAQMVTRGWTRVVPGDCGSAVDEPLKEPAYFVYARSARSRTLQPRDWGGQFRFCVRDANFWLQMPLATTACKPDGAFLAPFAPVATGGAQDMDHDADGGARTCDTGRCARRGYSPRARSARLPAEADSDAKHLNDAFAKFRVHAKLAVNATPADIFAALESARE